MSKRKINQEQREIIAVKVDNGKSTREIANDLHIPYTTVRTIIQKYLETGSITKKQRGGDKKSKLNNDEKNQLVSWVDCNPLLTLKELTQKVSEQFNKYVSLSTVNRCLKEFHYTMKKLTLSPERRNSNDVIEKRYEYALNLRRLEVDYDHKDFVFVDEVGFAVVTRPKSGRSKIGSPAILTVPAARSRNISVFAAMNKYSMIFNKIHTKPICGEDFRSCMIELKEKCLGIGILDPVIILDNAKIHHYKGLKTTIDDLGIKLNFLPPYSPFLNPIENCFSKWKNHVIRGEAKTEIELNSLIGEGFSSITDDDCQGFFKKMLRYLNYSSGKEVIYE